MINYKEKKSTFPFRFANTFASYRIASQIIVLLTLTNLFAVNAEISRLAFVFADGTGKACSAGACSYTRQHKHAKLSKKSCKKKIKTDSD